MNLELRSVILWVIYTFGMKGYKLWCPDHKSPEFLISRNMTFDRSIMLNPRNEDVDVDRDYGISVIFREEARYPFYSTH